MNTNSSHLLSILGGSLAILCLACASPEVVPLHGEDPEVQMLLGKSPPDDPRSSPLAAARRLHQALVQHDSDTVWTLLADGTRRALDDRGAEVSASGRELIDESTLPGPNGTVRKVRFETIFFGPRLVDLEELAADGEGQGTERKVVAISRDGARTELSFVREEEGWRYLQTGF